MATYLAGVSDVFPQVTPFQPNFNLIQQTLSTLQSRYEQGFASLRNVYNQVLNAPLSDVGNQEIRKNFMMEAQSKLKNLASVDLSMPENQTAAESVFAPFWEDDMLLKDTHLTKWYKNQIDKSNQYKYSKDDKIRSQYSDVAVQYLNNGLEKLHLAGRDPSKYAQLEKREFLPFTDLQTYLNDEATKVGLKVEWDSPQGPYMKRVTGGEGALPSFEAFAYSALGDKFTKQFLVSATVEVEDKIKYLKRYNPGISDQNALNVMSTSIVEDLKEAYTSKSKRLADELETIQKELASYGTGNLTESQREVASLLMDRRDRLKPMLESTQKDLNDVSDVALASKKLAASPEHYFASLIKERTVKNFARTRAASQQVHYEIDNVWKETANINLRKEELLIQKAEQDLKEREFEWKKLHPEKGSGSGSGSGSGVDPTNPEHVGIYEGHGSDDIMKSGTAYERSVEKQQQRWDAAHSKIFDMSTGVGIILYKMNVSDSDAAKYMTIMEKLSQDPDSKLSSEEELVFKNIGTKLQDYTGVAATKDFMTARAALLEATQKKLKEKTAPGGAGLDDKDELMLSSYTDAVRSLEEYSKQEKERKRLIREELSKRPGHYDNHLNYDRKAYFGDPRYPNMVDIVITRSDGTKDIASAKDLKKNFKKKYALYQGGPELSPEDLAEAYMSGELYIDNSQRHDATTIAYKGKRFDKISHDGGVLYNDNERDFNKQYNELFAELKSLEHRRGHSFAQKEARLKLNERVSSYLPEYQTETGRMGVVMGYDMSDDASASTVAALLNELANTSNREGIYIDKEYSQDSSKNEAIIQLLKLGKDELKKYISRARYKTIGVNYRPSFELELNPASEESKMQIGKKGLADLVKLPIEIDLSKHPSGAMLQKIRVNSGHYLHGGLLDGETYKSDPIMDSTGLKFTISPDRANNPNYLIVRYTRDKFNTQAGVMEPEPEQTLTYSLRDKSPDEVVDLMKDLWRKNRADNAALIKLYKERNPRKTITLSELEKERGRS